jgi:hypothetical protein
MLISHSTIFFILFPFVSLVVRKRGVADGKTNLSGNRALQRFRKKYISICRQDKGQ